MGLKLCQISVDGFFEPEVEGVADEGVADADFIRPGDLLLEESEVLEVEVMASVETEAEGTGGFGGADEGSDGGDAVCFISGGVWLGVEFHTVGAGTSGVVHHFLVGIHKDADTDASFVKASGDIGEEVEVRTGVPAVVGGYLVMAVGHQGDLRGTVLQDEGYELRDGVTLDIKLRGQERTQVADVLIADVALIRTRVNGDALGTEALTVLCHTQDIRVITTTGIADGGYLINIYAEFCHILHAFALFLLQNYK